MDEARKIRISAGTVAAYATLNGTTTAEEIWQALPLEVRMQTWGEELYGAVPLNPSLESPQEVVARGDLAYWPPGHAICIFFGPTPASRGAEIRAASPVNIVGRVTGDLKTLRKARDGARVLLARE